MLGFTHLHLLRALWPHTQNMGQPEDALLDLIGRIRRASSALSDASDCGEWSRTESDLMAAKAEGLSMAVALCEMQLRESRGEPRRVY